MSGFTAQGLEKKLIDLNSSQQSIQTLSLWLIHHRKHHKPIVQTWFAELKKAKPTRRLTFMYLANDVIQNSRKKGPEFSKEFGLVLKASFECVAKDSDDKTLASLERILSIWETRNIYETNQINSFKASLTLRKSQQTVKEVNNNNNNNNNVDTNVKHKEKIKEKDNKSIKNDKKDHKSKEEKQKTDKNVNKNNEKSVEKEPKKRLNENSKQIIPSKKRSTEESKKSLSHNQTKQKVTKTNDLVVKPVVKTAPVVNGPAVDPEVLIRSLQELETSASADAGVRQKIASLPTEVFDATLLEKIRDKTGAERLTKLVDEARSLLADYNSRLSQELEDRKSISLILSTYTQNQRDALLATQQKLNEYKEKLQKVVHVRNELKSHLQNLPDLSRLPSVTGLAPLPSACDLFNVARINNSGGGSVTSSVSPNESLASPVDYGTPGSNTS